MILVTAAEMRRLDALTIDLGTPGHVLMERAGSGAAGAVMGGAVVALCGKVWVPNRDPGRFPVCPECQEIYESMPPGGSDGPGEGGGDS